MNTTVIRGAPVSSGIARGLAVVLSEGGLATAPRRTIDETEVGTELAKFQAALREATQTLTALQQDVLLKVGRREAAIFDAQILMLRDPAFISEVQTRCATKRLNIEAAVSEVVQRFTEMFGAIDDVYMRERAADVRDVGRRVLDILLKQQTAVVSIPEGSIVVAPELLPSETARMNLGAIRGLVTERGGKTSHTAILTRSLGIPAVIGAAQATTLIRSGDALIVDGTAGTVFVNPRPAVVAEYERLEAHLRSYREELREQIDLPAETPDGTRVHLAANIGKAADADAAALFRADGIGLYRTEFNFLIRDRCPTADEQLVIYETVIARIAPREVVLRLLDLGSDKALPYFPLPAEPNPALGLRGLRLLLAHRALLDAQLEAVLRLAPQHAVALSLPGVTGPEDVRAIRGALEDVRARLREAGCACRDRLRLGAMIETPAAAMLTGPIAREVDFLSVGTNDLIQYVLAADRTSHEMLAHYDPLHPAVLRTLKAIVDAAAAESKPVSICGEMAGNSAYTAILLGLGVRSLSVTPGEILEIKRCVRALRLPEATALAADLLRLDTPDEVRARLAATSVPRPRDPGAS
ncbi:MAG: phosphoenolpyruvate--protein phosphotransferase [Opitutaceae bacterium]|nr:phosphoenolpyruvate--protein phosphotransferase [Opitutaceae bacterium]